MFSTQTLCMWEHGYAARPQSQSLSFAKRLSRSPQFYNSVLATIEACASVFLVSNIYHPFLRTSTTPVLENHPQSKGLQFMAADTMTPLSLSWEASTKKQGYTAYPAQCCCKSFQYPSREFGSLEHQHQLARFTVVFCIPGAPHELPHT